jgi:hypothetical protein
MTPVPAPGDNLNGGQDTRLDVHSQKKAMRLQKQIGAKIFLSEVNQSAGCFSH